MLRLRNFAKDLSDVFSQAKDATPLEALKMFILPSEFEHARRLAQPPVKVSLQCRGVKLDFKAK